MASQGELANLPLKDLRALAKKAGVLYVGNYRERDRSLLIQAIIARRAS